MSDDGCAPPRGHFATDVPWSNAGHAVPDAGRLHNDCAFDTQRRPLRLLPARTRAAPCAAAAGHADGMLFAKAKDAVRRGGEMTLVDAPSALDELHRQMIEAAGRPL